MFYGLYNNIGQGTAQVSICNARQTKSISKSSQYRTYTVRKYPPYE